MGSSSTIIVIWTQTLCGLSCCTVSASNVLFDDKYPQKRTNTKLLFPYSLYFRFGSISDGNRLSLNVFNLAEFVVSAFSEDCLTCSMRTASRENQCESV